jgi:hypothetical protein
LKTISLCIKQICMRLKAVSLYIKQICL